MTTSEVLAISRDLLFTALLLSLPAVAASLLVGLLVSIFQTITSIQEQTLSFATRLLAVGVITLLSLPWVLQTANGFTLRMFSRMVEASR
jgi:flagellar biosynthetic protein FliQ